MTEKTEALRLADALDKGWCPEESPKEMADAAAELRRLHQFAEDQIGRATAAEAALQMTKATHALKIAAVEAQRDALLEALKEIHQATMRNGIVLAKCVGINAVAGMAIAKAERDKNGQA